MWSLPFRTVTFQSKTLRDLTVLMYPSDENFKLNLTREETHLEDVVREHRVALTELYACHPDEEWVQRFIDLSLDRIHLLSCEVTESHRVIHRFRKMNHVLSIQRGENSPMPLKVRCSRHGAEW